MVAQIGAKGAHMARNIYKRGKVYWGRVTRKGREHRESLKTDDWATAKRRLKDWITRLDAADWGDVQPMRFDDAMIHFLGHHLPTLRPSSQRRYLTSIRMMTPYFEGRLLHDINHAAMADYEHRRRADGASAPTVRRDLACLSSMFESVILDKEVEILNPVPTFMKKRKKRGNLKESPARIRYLSHDEEVALLNACSGRLKYLRLMIVFAIDTGLRLEEQLSLVHAQINHQRKEVTIKQTKSGVPRVVPLLPRSAQIAAQQPIPIRRPHYLFHKKSTGDRYGKLTRGLASACKAAGIAELRWHDLRRTCGCRLLQDHRLSMDEVSKWLGHSSVKQTERAYAFLSVDQLHKRVGTIPGT
ncbi:MAG: tyrosine-type recombinase/integrase [Alphaproteobacteria bacterium]|nr:tyrosine-type recombinase/integrase [Alphaproteobacteria bacterium]